MSVSAERLEQINREDYTDCLEWLKDKEGLNLETKTQSKGLKLEEKEAYLTAAGEAIQTIIVKKKQDDKTNVNPNIDTFRQMCRNGGINIKEQREIFREQTCLYYKLYSEDQLLAEWEAEEYEKLMIKLKLALVPKIIVTKLVLVTERIVAILIILVLITKIIVVVLK